jgi:hypothetical protein
VLNRFMYPYVFSYIIFMLFTTHIFKVPPGKWTQRWQFSNEFFFFFFSKTNTHYHYCIRSFAAARVYRGIVKIFILLQYTGYYVYVRHNTIQKNRTTAVAIKSILFAHYDPKAVRRSDYSPPHCRKKWNRPFDKVYYPHTFLHDLRSYTCILCCRHNTPVGIEYLHCCSGHTRERNGEWQ